MHHREMENIIDDVYAQIKALRETKGKEYASEEDTLADFKEVAKEAGITPLQAWATYVKKHQRAIDTFIREGHVKSETIESRVVDVVVYHLLLLGLIRDAPEPLPVVESSTRCALRYRITGLYHNGEFVSCELPFGHVTPHYGRTPEGHGFGFDNTDIYVDPGEDPSPRPVPPRPGASIADKPSDQEDIDLQAARRAIDRYGVPPPGEGTHPLQRHRDSMG